MDANHFHLLRRSLQDAHGRLQKDGEIKLEIPAWGYALLVGTVLCYVFASWAVKYTYAEVIATLAMIETPTATAIVATAPEEPEYSDTPLLDGDKKITAEEEILLVKNKPITSKLRTAVRHLRRQAGYFSRFRGVHIAALYTLAFHGLSQLVVAFLGRSFVVKSITHIAVSVLLARLGTQWTHHVISMPNDKRLIHPAIPRKNFKKLVAPTAIYAITEQIVLLAPLGLSYYFGFAQLAQKYLNNPGKIEPPKQGALLYGQVLVVLAASLIGKFWILMPAQVALTRVQGSLLQEEEEPIVPFDRTFGGKVIPEIVGGSGKISMREAWKTFDWNATIRLVKIYVKVFFIQIFLCIAFFTVMAANLYLIFGKQIKAIVVAMKQNARNM